VLSDAAAELGPDPGHSGFRNRGAVLRTTICVDPGHRIPDLRLPLALNMKILLFCIEKYILKKPISKCFKILM